MFVYEKKLQYPVKITNTNPRLAALIISQYGGRYPHTLQKERQLWRSFCIIHRLSSSHRGSVILPPSSAPFSIL